MSDAPISRLESFDAPVTALVVGASRGIGLGFVRHLLGDDRVTRVFAAGRDPDDAPELRRLAEDLGGRLRTLTMDVTDEASVRSAAEVIDSGQRLDLLINCAGALHDADSLSPERRLADIEPRNLRRSFDVHALGPALIAKHFSPRFDRKARAVLASISARVGSIGDNRLGGWYSYRASKSAHNMIIRNLSIELRRRHRGLICVALHPGTVDTQLSRPFQEGIPDGRLFSVDRAVNQLVTVIDGLGSDSNGRFYAWDGQEIPW